MTPACSYEYQYAVNYLGTYRNGDDPEHPPPSLCLSKKPTCNRTDDRTHQRTQSPDCHHTASFLLNDHICNGPATYGQWDGPEQALQESEADQHVEITGDSAGDGEYEETCVAALVDRQTTIELRERRNDL